MKYEFMKRVYAVQENVCVGYCMGACVRGCIDIINTQHKCMHVYMLPTQIPPTTKQARAMVVDPSSLPTSNNSSVPLPCPHLIINTLPLSRCCQRGL